MSKVKKVILEQGVRLSKSRIWHLQRDYYEEEGIEAWSEAVPFYVTSNPVIANTYAQLAIALANDYVLQNKYNVAEPFYIIELGTGPGQFSFYFLRRLQELQPLFKNKSIQFRYIMTDQSMNNVNFWREHTALRPFIEQGILDFAQYDLECNENIQLIERNEILKPGCLTNPLIVFANYIFDSVCNDVFTVSDGKLTESLLTLSTDSNNIKEDYIEDLEKLQTHYKPGDEVADYYKEPVFNAVLQQYKERIIDSHFLFPIGSLNAIQWLESFSQAGMLLVSSDKAYTNLEELDNLNYPELTFHGSFSVMVNYHAIAQYFSHAGGDFLLQTPREGITTAVFASGFHFKDYQETQLALHEYIEQFSPADYFVLHEHVSEAVKQYSIPVLAAHLSLSRWDPYIFDRINSRITDEMEETDMQTLTYLASKMPKIAEQFYFLPGVHDTLFDIAVFYHGMDQYPEAFEYYKQSTHYFGENFVVCYNKGLCQYYLKNYESSLAFFKQALTFDAKSKDAKGWVKTVEKVLKK